MNPQLTTYYMADRIDRQSRDRRAHRVWLAREATGNDRGSVIGGIAHRLGMLAAGFTRPRAAPMPATVPAMHEVADCCA
jgi:hypothetical protein